MHTTYVRSWGFLGLGIAFALGTGYILLEDVFQHGAKFETDHLLTIMMIVGTLVAGHNFFPALMSGRLFLALGCAVVFLGGTLICVSGSAGRAAKVLMLHDAIASKDNDAFADVKSDLQTARSDRKSLAAQLAKECGTGNGVKCQGYKKALEEKDDYIRLLQVRLDGLKPSAPANGDIKYFSDAIVLLWNAPREWVEKMISTLQPLAKAALGEVATLLFFGFAFGHRKAEKIEEKEEVEVRGFLPAPTPEMAVLQAASGPLSNGEFAKRLRVSPGYASKIIERLAQQGIVEKEKIGREVAIKLIPKN